MMPLVGKAMYDGMVKYSLGLLCSHVFQMQPENLVEKMYMQSF